jgi:uncharacterized protein (TIGR02611 family)
VLDRVRATRAGRWSLKVGIGVVGGLLVVLGLVLVPAPGPGWLIVIAGLSVLALEFDWARNLLELVRARVLGWTHWIGARSLAFRAVVGLAGIVALSVGLWVSLKFTLDFDMVRWAGNQIGF